MSKLALKTMLDTLALPSTLTVHSLNTTVVHHFLNIMSKTNIIFCPHHILNGLCSSISSFTISQTDRIIWICCYNLDLHMINSKDGLLWCCAKRYCTCGWLDESSCQTSTFLLQGFRQTQALATCWWCCNRKTLTHVCSAWQRTVNAGAAESQGNRRTRSASRLI